MHELKTDPKRLLHEIQYNISKEYLLIQNHEKLSKMLLKD